jgi:hypothetical protein
MARSRVTYLRSGYLPWPNLSLRCNLWTLPFRRPQKCVRTFEFVTFINQFWPSQETSFNPSPVSLFAEGAASLPACLLWTTQFFSRVAWRSPTTDSTIWFHLQGSGVLSAALYSSPAARALHQPAERVPASCSIFHHTQA